MAETKDTKDTAPTTPPFVPAPTLFVAAPPAVKSAAKFVVKTDGPDVRTAEPVEGAPVVQTSMGPLDRDTVVNNRVGGVGVVSLQRDPEETAGGQQPMAAESKVVEKK